MGIPTSTPRGQRPLFVEAKVELVHQEGHDATILAALAAVRKDLMRRLERIEAKIGTPSDSEGVNQATIDRLTAQLKAATDQLMSDVSASTPSTP